jgi:hypothetical protein
MADGPSAYQPSLLATIGQTAVVALALALGTILVESLASEIWPPGHRSRMIRQIVQPLLYGSGVFALALLAEHLRPRLGRWVAIGGMAALCAFAFVGTLENNRLLNADTAVDQNVISGLKRLLPNTNQPVTIVLIPQGATLLKWDSYLSDEYVQTELATPFLYTRVLHPGSQLTEWTDHDSVVLGPDRQGAFLVTSGLAPHWVPYSDILFARYDGQTVSRLDTVTADDLSGFRVAFQRNGPITTTLDPETLTGCPADIDFDQPVAGTGWSVPELAPDGTTFTWTDSVSSTLDLGMAIERPLDFEARIYTAIAPNVLDSVQMNVNGQPVLTEMKPAANGATVVSGTIPVSGPLTRATELSPVILVAIGKTSELEITVDRTEVPEGGNRTLGIAFDSIRFDCGGTGSTQAASDLLPPGQETQGFQDPASAPRGTPATDQSSGTSPGAAASIGAPCPPPRASAPEVVAAPCLSANPNPVPIVGSHGTTTIAWSVGETSSGSTGQVYVSKDGRPEILFLEGRRGEAKARIRPGSVYEFRLYAGPDRSEAISSVIVSTIEGSGDALQQTP